MTDTPIFDALAARRSAAATAHVEAPARAARPGTGRGGEPQHRVGADRAATVLAFERPRHAPRA